MGRPLGHVWTFADRPLGRSGRALGAPARETKLDMSSGPQGVCRSTGSDGPRNRPLRFGDLGEGKCSQLLRGRGETGVSPAGPGDVAVLGRSVTAVYDETRWPLSLRRTGLHSHRFCASIQWGSLWPPGLVHLPGKALPVSVRAWEVLPR